MATRKNLQGSVHLSGKTSQIVHRMLQDMMLGTVEKNRVEDLEDKQIAKPKSMIETFLRARLADVKKDKFDDEEEDLRQNPFKYDIYEERDIVTASDGASTSRRAIRDLQISSNNNQGNTLNPEDVETAAVKPKLGNVRTINIEDSVNNSENDEVSDKHDSTTKIFGYHKTKQKLDPDIYEEYCYNEGEFYPSVLNE